MNIPTRALKERLRAARVPWPTMPQGHNFCLTYHIKGVCNTRCGNTADYIPHTVEEDAQQIAWCDLNYNIRVTNICISLCICRILPDHF